MKTTQNSFERLAASDLFAALRGGDFLAALRVLRYIESVAVQQGEKCVPTVHVVRKMKELVETMHTTRIVTRKECRAAMCAANIYSASERGLKSDIF